MIISFFSNYTKAPLYVSQVATGLILYGLSATAATISQDFEGSTLGSTTPPTDWSLVGVAGSTSSYITSTGDAGAGLGGELTGNYSTNSPSIPGGYLVNSGDEPFDLTKPITGSFDFFIEEAGNYSGAIFLIGDIQSGIAETAAGEYIGMHLREQTFGARAQIVDGAGTILTTDNSYRISSDTWYTADFFLDSD